MLTRLRHVIQVNPATPAFVRLPGDSLVTFLPMENVWPGGRLDLSQQREKAQVAVGYTRFQSGDVLVPKITPTFEAARSVLVPALGTTVGAGTTELHVLRPGPQIESRYLGYVVNSVRFLRLGEAEMYGVAGQKRVPDDFIRDFVIDLPELEAQRRIVSFLDAETGSIDRLASLRGQQQRVLNERVGAAIERMFESFASTKRTRLKFLLRQKPRYGVLVPEFVDDGVPFIRVNDLLDLSGRAEDLRRIPASLSEQYSRTVVQKDDILLSVVGTVGRAVVAPGALIGANVARAVSSVRARPGVQPELIVAWTMTADFTKQVRLATGTDTAQPTLGMEDLSNFTLYWPSDPDERLSGLAEIAAIITATDALREKLRRQEAVLAERRQALITAAVTGQFDVTTARGADLS